MSMKFGQFLDMVACLGIDEGGARQKGKKKVYSFDEALALE